MRKKRIAFIPAIALILSGCAQMNSMLEAKILKETGIAEDSDYIQYQQMLEQGRINEEGNYEEPEAEEAVTVPGDGKIHVTIASNSHIKVNFFFDEQRIETITACYVDPGDKIYLSDPIASHPVTNHYSLDGFRLVSYDNDYVVQYSEMVYPDSVDHSITIPEDFNGTELTVQPIGQYENRTIGISDYVMDDDGSRHELNGEWRIDEQVFRQSTAQVNASNDYDLEYHYDPAEYYITSTQPEAYAVDEQSGIVYFSHETAMSEVEQFEVELHKWITVNLNGNSKKGLDGVIVRELPADLEGDKVKKVKCGDLIIVSTKGDYQATSNDMECVGKPESLSTGYKTTFEVPQTSVSEMSILIGNKLTSFQVLTINNGKITVKKKDGTVIKEGENIDGGTDVTVNITPDNGYYVSGKDVKNNIYEKKMTYSKYQETADSIINDHKILKYISLSLEPAGEHGTTEYKVDNQSKSGKITGLKAGQTIKAEYTLTDDGYVFEDETGNVINNISNFIQNTLNKAKRTVDIKVTAEMEGNTINGEDYVAIKKRGQ